MKTGRCSIKQSTFSTPNGLDRTVFGSFPLSGSRMADNRKESLLKSAESFPCHLVGFISENLPSVTTLPLELSAPDINSAEEQDSASHVVDPSNVSEAESSATILPPPPPPPPRSRPTHKANHIKTWQCDFDLPEGETRRVIAHVKLSPTVEERGGFIESCTHPCSCQRINCSGC